MKNEAKPRVYDILAKAFVQEGLCEHVLRFSGCEHELGRALVRGRMPHGLCQARALRRSPPPWRTRERNWDMGVATVTCGPGVTQLITALPAAVRAHLPLVVFAR